MLLQIRLLISLALSRYELPCKHRIIPNYRCIIGCRIAFSDISGIAFSCFQYLITTDRLFQLVAASQIVCYMIREEQYHQFR